MKCQDVRDVAAEFLQEGTQAAGVDSHLAGCEACRSYVADLRAQVEMFRSAPRLEPPADAWARVQSGLIPPKPVRIWGWASAAAAAIVLFAVLTLIPSRPPKHFEVILRDRPESFGREERSRWYTEYGSSGGAMILDTQTLGGDR
jgi:hypothetical protein